MQLRVSHCKSIYSLYHAVIHRVGTYIPQIGSLREYESTIAYGMSSTALVACGEEGDMPSVIDYYLCQSDGL